MQTSFKNNKKEKSETMGYLAQRKKHLRTDFILKSLLVLLAFFSAAAFAGNAFGQFLNQWRFQFYLLSLLVMFYALFNRFFLYSFLALLLLLRQLQPRFGYTLSACHVNHGLRGQSADRDEAFVRAECARLGVPLRVFHAAELALPPAHAGEDWARRLRYTAFVQLQGQGIDAIATAHTANDQAETLLLRLARGTGLHGAGGIRPRRPGYCRPLLGLTRGETEALCAAFGQGWVTDETNESDAYARNRLRHGAVPALRSVNDAAEENLARFCEKAARADAYFARQAEQLLSGARLDAAQTARKAPEAKAAWRRL